MKVKKIALIIFPIFLFSVVIFTNPIIGKYLSGTARLIGKQFDAEIYIGEKKNENAKVFYSNSDFYNKQKRDYLILYLRSVKAYNGIAVFVIDKKNEIVYIPNSSKSNYNIYFENLLQSDSGANVLVPINDSLKGLGFDPKLVIQKNKIEFEILDSEKRILKIRIKVN